jgi:hypothetical protein
MVHVQLGKRLTFDVAVIQRHSADLHQDFAFACHRHWSFGPGETVQTLQGRNPLLNGHFQIASEVENRSPQCLKQQMEKVGDVSE